MRSRRVRVRKRVAVELGAKGDGAHLVDYLCKRVASRSGVVPKPLNPLRVHSEGLLRMRRVFRGFGTILCFLAFLHAVYLMRCT